MKPNDTPHLAASPPDPHEPDGRDGRDETRDPDGVGVDGFGASSGSRAPAVRVALRYARSTAIGPGHARRARSLDAALAARGIEALHLVPAAARDAVVADGVPPGRVVAATSEQLSARVASLGVTHVVLDVCWGGNAAGAVREVAALRTSAAATIVIDGMPPDHYPGSARSAAPDLLVVPYLGADRTGPAGERALCGARYAMLGPEFAGLDAAPVARIPRRVLVSCGGSDEDGLSGHAARALVAGGASVDVVVGPMFDARARDALVAWAADEPAARLHRAPSSLASLIAASDRVVGRPGPLRYEAAALRRPGIYLARGTAYRDYFEGFAASGLAEMHFEPDDGGREGFLERLASLRAHPGDAGCGPARTAVDAGGAARVVDAILRRHTTSDTAADPT